MGEIRELRPTRCGIPRRPVAHLAAVVVGNISGRGRSMRSDGGRERSRIELIEHELIEPSVLEHQGQLVKTTAGGFIAIFDSPVEAARCSVVIRQRMVARNESLPEPPWVECRIGVNLGDVITAPDDVYGEGVHIASHLAAVAGSGQVCISGGMYEQIKHKLFYGYESLGDRKVTNIAVPVAIYRMLPDLGDLHGVPTKREIILTFLLGLTLLFIAGGWWYLFV